jgi:hypothetical protein
VLDLWQDPVHGFELANAEGAPATANKADDKAFFRQEVGGGNRFRVLILKFKNWSFLGNRKTVIDDVLFVQFRDCARMNGLNVSGNIFRDEVFALRENLAQGPDVRAGSRFFERSPFHKCGVVSSGNKLHPR